MKESILALVCRGSSRKKQAYKVEVVAENLRRVLVTRTLRVTRKLGNVTSFSVTDTLFLFSFILFLLYSIICFTTNCLF